MPRPPKLAYLLLLLATACTFPFPLPRLVFDTPTPSPPPGPTATPIPAAIVTFNVRIPGGTPAGSAPAVALLDPVGGGRITVVLTHAGGDVWTGGVQALTGTVLRYKYIRPLPAFVEELTVSGEEVPFRLLAVTGQGLTADDLVAAWDDTPFAGQSGALEGRVWNGSASSGVMGLLVSAGGQVVVTDRDGVFFLYNLPAGPQRVTVLAPDGSLRPVQDTALIQPGQRAAIDLVSADPNAVHLTFLVRPPAGADTNAVLRLVGDVWQLGDDFIPAVHGASVTGARAPSLIPLADGRWSVRVLLYAGTILRYKYTLGDGAWNGELDAGGSPRLRQIIVPPTDALIDDTVTAWRAPNAATITFEAQAPPETPSSDSLAIQFRPGGEWQPPLPMWRLGPNQWRFVLYNPAGFSGTVYYRYCRNFACGSADDSSTAGPAAPGRFFTAALFGQNLRDTITAWQWLGPQPGGAGVLPAIQPRAPFDAGFDLDESWQPAYTPVLVNAFQSMHAAGARWVTFTRLAARLPGAAPAPAFADSPALSPLPLAWREIAARAQNAGLRVSLHPVTCPYTPYGACDYWTGLSFSPAFWNDWFANYERFLLSQAELARLTGTDLLIVGDFKLRPALPGEPEAPPDAEARWRSLIARVRAVYGGALGFELLMSDAVWPSPPPFLDAVDVIRLWWWSALAEGSAAPVADMAVAAAVRLDSHVLPLQQRFNRPVIISAAYLAAGGAATQCLRRPDGQCHSFEAFAPSAPDLAGFGLDLQEQADAYTALLVAVNDRPWLRGLFSYGYHPQAILRDKSLSVRGKPAETVLSAWWPLLRGP